MKAKDLTVAAEAMSAAEAVAASDPRRALELLEPAVATKVRRLDPTMSARASYLRAQLLCERGSFGAALDAVHAARRDWLSADRQLDALSTDIGKATVLHELGEYRQAVAVSVGLLDQMASFAAEPGQMAVVASMTARTHNNLGNAWSRLGDHERALRHYDVAANLFQGLGDPVLQASADANRGLTYLRLGMGHRALGELIRAEELLAANGRVLAAAKCRIDIADAHLQLDEVEDAIELLTELRETLHELGAKPELGRLGLTLAHAYLRADLLHEARREAHAAADIFAELPATGEYGRATYVSGLASIMLGEEQVADEELAMAERLFADCGDAGYQARVEIARAQLAEQGGNLEQARALGIAALTQLEVSHDSVPAFLARLLLARVGTAEEAEMHLHLAAEKVATLGLMALVPSLELARARHERRTGATGRAIARLRVALAQDHESGPVPGDADLRLALQGARTGMYDELIELLLDEGSHRHVAEAWQWSTFARSRSLARHLAELTDAALPALPEGPLLQYHVLGADVLAFVVREGEVHVRRLSGARRPSVELLREWTQICTQLSSVGRDRVPAGAAALDRTGLVLADLHRLLVTPVEDLLDDLYGQPLLVLAHRHLTSVPFEALQDRGETFAARHSLVFAPGLLPGLQASMPTPVAGTTLVLAVLDAKAPAIEREGAVVVEARPHAEAFFGEEATAEVLFAQASGKEIVHLACHGHHWSAKPLHSALELADRPVTAAEVAGLDLGGSLVVLSACAAGQSSAGPAESTGIGWAFLAAGARGVIASLWAVEDEVAVSLMDVFYRHLAAGVSPRDALDAAREEIRRTHPHPYHWSSFRFLCSPATALSEGLAP